MTFGVLNSSNLDLGVKDKILFWEVYVFKKLLRDYNKIK